SPDNTRSKRNSGKDRKIRFLKQKKHSSQPTGGVQKSPRDKNNSQYGTSNSTTLSYPDPCEKESRGKRGFVSQLGLREIFYFNRSSIISMVETFRASWPSPTISVPKFTCF